VYQIEVAKGYGSNEWRDDLKKVLMKCGLNTQELVFLFTDTQIVQVRGWAGQGAWVHCWCPLLVPPAGTPCWCPLLVPPASALCWCSLLLNA